VFGRSVGNPVAARSAEVGRPARRFGRWSALVSVPLDIHEKVIRTTLLGTLYASHVAYR
jgi:hypothetical protein